MELNIGDYCRDKEGNIDKLIDIRKITEHNEVGGATTMTYTERYFEQNKIKAPIIKNSPNIIDLIEVGDLMYIDISPDDCGGIVAPRIAETPRELKAFIKDIQCGNYILKGIVTREQLASMKYKIGE